MILIQSRRALGLRVRWLVACLCLIHFSMPRESVAWNPLGHHSIGVLAFDLLEPNEQAEIIRLLETHPDFERLFKSPADLRGKDAIPHWNIGTAGNWPDMIRGTDADRPTWHYELGASLVLGPEKDSNVPDSPGALPTDATLATTDLYISQAYNLCRQVFADSNRSDADRAIALCWICHLVADGHQPCHAGSLYAPLAFPDGDRGANFIRIGRGNLHAVWDGLLGSMNSPNDVRKLVNELRSQSGIVKRIVEHRDAFAASDINGWIAAEAWINESRVASRQYVYTPEILAPVQAVMRGLTPKVADPKPSPQYFETAGKIARVRATQAGYRLATVISEDLRRAKATVNESL